MNDEGTDFLLHSAWLMTEKCNKIRTSARTQSEPAPCYGDIMDMGGRSHNDNERDKNAFNASTVVA